MFSINTCSRWLKGVPKKNIKPLNGKPLIHYTIEAARAIFSDEDICVSTDSEEIKVVSEKTGLKVPFLRPDYLSTDTADSQSVLLHALDFYEAKGEEYDVVILLQPTSPFRTSQHIQEAIDLYSADLDMVVSVKKAKGNPYFSLFEENENGFLEISKKGNFTRRQDCPKVYEYNGSIYVRKGESLLKYNSVSLEKTLKCEMDEFYSVDIDNQFRFSNFYISFQFFYTCYIFTIDKGDDFFRQRG